MPRDNLVAITIGAVTGSVLLLSAAGLYALVAALRSFHQRFEPREVRRQRGQDLLDTIEPGSGRPV